MGEQREAEREIEGGQREAESDRDTDNVRQRERGGEHRKREKVSERGRHSTGFQVLQAYIQRVELI